MLGLGRWATSYPEEVKKIIDKFLKDTPNLCSELKVIAEHARSGFDWTDEERRAMILSIETAFDDTVHPDDDNITNHDHCLECAEIAEAFKGKTWQEIGDVKFLRYHEAALSLFRPVAFRYYLPAFMRAVLIDSDAADVIWDGLFFILRHQTLTLCRSRNG